MSWTIAISATALVAVAWAALCLRRRELSHMRDRLADRTTAIDRGSHLARLQYPHIDLALCGGCATCISACPEQGVLELIHGQAVVVHGARCVGHGVCAAECPLGAIAITLGDVSERDDIPALDDRLGVPGVDGLFLAGEVTGYALIRTAIQHGRDVATAVAQRVEEIGQPDDDIDEDILDLCIVGAGPAGLACSLEARSRDLDFVTLDRESIGGTVAHYPRRKLVMTQPVELPLHGTLRQTSYLKEELMELWTGVAAEHQLPIRTGVSFLGLERSPEGTFTVQTNQGDMRARNVCLALGRRGEPRKLDVPGEDLPKVSYSLIDAQSYEGRRILVVGGGDSAIEAALALSSQPDNTVTISYRKAAFFRLKARNEERLVEAVAGGQINAIYESVVTGIEQQRVLLERSHASGTERLELPNDDVFILVGGIAPFSLLKSTGVSFDQSAAPQPASPAPRSVGLARGLTFALLFSLVAVAWAWWNADYYSLPADQRADFPAHAWLRPAGSVGLFFGVAATGLILVNLAYLLRRSPRIRFTFGSLQTWMTSHLATGILAFLLALHHCGMAPSSTAGGHAFIAMAVLVASGVIGRYFYACVPRAANGRELELEEVRQDFTSASGEWDRINVGFAQRARTEFESMVDGGRWETSWFRRLGALIRLQVNSRKALSTLRRKAVAEGLPEDQIEAFLELGRRARTTALMASHHEDLRGLLASWRYVHRWMALLMVILVGTHIVVALRYSEILS